MTICRQCGDQVQWVQVEGRKRCFNLNTLTDHWDSCSKRRWQQTKATGEKFEGEKNRATGERVSGYRNSIHGTKLSAVEGVWQRGKYFREIHHEPGCPNIPWEPPCSCPELLAWQKWFAEQKQREAQDGWEKQHPLYSEVRASTYAAARRRCAFNAIKRQGGRSM